MRRTISVRGAVEGSVSLAEICQDERKSELLGQEINRLNLSCCIGLILIDVQSLFCFVSKNKSETEYALGFNTRLLSHNKVKRKINGVSLVGGKTYGMFQ